MRSGLKRRLRAGADGGPARGGDAGRAVRALGQEAAGDLPTKPGGFGQHVLEVPQQPREFDGSKGVAAAGGWHAGVRLRTAALSVIAPASRRVRGVMARTERGRHPARHLLNTIAVRRFGGADRQQERANGRAHLVHVANHEVTEMYPVNTAGERACNPETHFDHLMGLSDRETKNRARREIQCAEAAHQRRQL